MLVKKLKFDDQVLKVIKEIEFSEDGLHGRITSGQLDRQLYVKVNKALEAMGGKWNRKTGTHIFQEDPRPNVEGLLDNGVVEVARDGWFPTQPPIVKKMIDIAGGVNGTILEPEAGEGHIVDVLVANGADKDKIYCIEKNHTRGKILMNKGYSTQVDDFLKVTPYKKYDRIFMNPPFEERQDTEHIMHAYSFLNPDGVLVAICSEGPFFAQDSKSVSFIKWLDSVGSYEEKLPKEAFKDSGTTVSSRIIRIKNLDIPPQRVEQLSIF